MELRPGYKWTDVGFIPEDWDVNRLLNFASIATGSTPPTSDATNYGDDFLFVSPVDMGEVKRITKTEKRLSPKGFSKSRKFPKGSILFVCIGSTIGKCGIASENLTSNQQINAIFPSSTFSEDYLYYAMTAAAPRVRALAGEQAVPLVNKTQFSETYVPLPPLPEQHVIAQALSDVDALLTTLDQVIAKKRDLKQATMQQLLTGKTRLPRFAGEWEVKRLGDVAEIVMGQSPSSSNYNSIGNGLPLIQGNADIVNRWAIKRTYTTQITKRGKAGDVLMSVRAPVGEVSRTSFEVCLGRGVCAIRFPNDFLYHSLVFFEPNWAKHSKGSTFDSVNSADVNAVDICLPVEEAEQVAIAAILSDVDAELAALESRRDKTRNIKQAMMQELLTGKTRLV